MSLEYIALMNHTDFTGFYIIFTISFFDPKSLSRLNINVGLVWLLIKQLLRIITEPLRFKVNSGKVALLH